LIAAHPLRRSTGGTRAADRRASCGAVRPRRRTGIRCSPRVTDQREDAVAVLSDHARETTLRPARAMYPQDGLPDEAYEKVVRQIEATRAATRPSRRRSSRASPRSTRRAVSGAFGRRPARGTAACRGRRLLQPRARRRSSSYDNPLVWKAFGYEDPSVHLGGYVHRGFDELDWLPDPPIDSIRRPDRTTARRSMARYRCGPP
jgi:hypothetical protein